MISLLKRIWSRAGHILSDIRNKLSKFNKKFDSIFDFSWLLSSLAAKIVFIIQGVLSLVFGFASLVFAILNFGSLVDIVKGTVQGSSFWMEKLQNVVAGYPSFQSLVSTMDNQLSGLSTYFTPPVTFSYILQITGIGDAVNAIVICAVQGVAFVISLRLLFWSLGRVKLSMIKPIR